MEDEREDEEKEEEEEEEEEEQQQQQQQRQQQEEEEEEEENEREDMPDMNVPTRLDLPSPGAPWRRRRHSSVGWCPCRVPLTPARRGRL